MNTGTINGVPYTVPQGYKVVLEESLQRSQLALQLLSDLDRSAAGRHRGDVEAEDPTGVSQGNPLLPPGTHIGYSLYGNRRIVVPEKTFDPAAWYQEVD